MAISRRTKWDDAFYVQCYKLALQGMTNDGIARMLKVANPTFEKWLKDRPALKQAIKDGRGTNKKSSSITFRDYIFDSLPPRLRKLWRKIDKCSDASNSYQRIQALFRKNGEDARKHLFLYALTSTNFNPSQACKRVGISLATLKGWIARDMEFAELVDEIEVHKDNFFESALVEKVAEGDTQAILFANRNRNKKRGYGDAVEVEVNGQINHNHNVDLAGLDLPIKVLRMVYKAIEKKQKSNEELPTGRAGQALITNNKD